MAHEQKKRPRPVTVSSQQSKKRQKVESSILKAATHAMKIPIALDELPWNEVEVPEMFEDAEGFFGLEEVDGVEVVRDGNKVQYVCYLSDSYVSC
jgi:ATP-dependent RNA helicase DDX24/MAK5